MKYEQALEAWGMKMLSERCPKAKFGPGPVEVKFEFKPEVPCCGGFDPQCYCSLEESASAKVIITDGNRICFIQEWEFDISKMVREIVECAGGIDV